MPEHNVCTIYVDKYSIFKQKIMNEILNLKLTIEQTRRKVFSCQVKKKIMFLTCDLLGSFIFLLVFKVYVLTKLNPVPLILPISPPL